MPVPKRWGSHEIEYLKNKQVFALPNSAFLSLCLQGYVEHFHFSCPVLDLPEFLDSIAGNGEDSAKQVGLFLLYCVLFNGVAFVDENSILDTGYESRLAVRESFFTRAKVIFYTYCIYLDSMRPVLRSYQGFSSV